MLNLCYPFALVKSQRVLVASSRQFNRIAEDDVLNADAGIVGKGEVVLELWWPASVANSGANEFYISDGHMSAATAFQGYRGIIHSRSADVGVNNGQTLEGGAGAGAVPEGKDGSVFLGRFAVAILE